MDITTWLFSEIWAIQNFY